MKDTLHLLNQIKQTIQQTTQCAAVIQKACVKVSNVKSFNIGWRKGDQMAKAISLATSMLAHITLPARQQYLPWWISTEAQLYRRIT